MITAIHAMLYSRDAEAVRAFFKNSLKLPHVDAGEGWLIFALPPAEIAVHPTHTEHGPELYLMCDDVERTVAELRPMGAVATKPIVDQGWGLLTTIRIPGGVEFGLYEPRHPVAATLRALRKSGPRVPRRKPAGTTRAKAKRRR